MASEMVVALTSGVGVERVVGVSTAMAVASSVGRPANPCVGSGVAVGSAMTGVGSTFSVGWGSPVTSGAGVSVAVILCSLSTGTWSDHACISDGTISSGSAAKASRAAIAARTTNITTNVLTTLVNTYTSLAVLSLYNTSRGQRGHSPDSPDRKVHWSLYAYQTC